MHRPRTYLLVCLVALCVLAAPTVADAARWKGKTKDGSTIKFRSKGKRVARVITTVFVNCFDIAPGSSNTRTGFEVFRPGGRFRFGREGTRRVERYSALNGGKMTFKHVFKVNRRGRRAKGRLRVSFSTSSYDPFSNTITFTNCSGSTTFKARRR